MKKIVKDALVLFAITLVAGILLGVVYQITLDPIIKSFYTFIQSPHLPSFLPQACKLQVHNLHPL